MKYTKQQVEMLALLVIMGCAVVVLAFLYMVKPNFVAIAKCKKGLNKTESAMAKLNGAPAAMAKAKKEMDSLTDTIERGEKAVFSGLEAGPPLTSICVQAARALNPKPAYGEQTDRQLLEFAQRGTDGKPLTRHYDEVSRTLDVHGVNFFDLCRFLSAVESTNEGLRVAHLQIDTVTLEPEAQGRGKVSAKFELSLLGIREGKQPEEIAVGGPEGFSPGSKRNPFGAPGVAMEPTVDPLVRLRETLKRLRVQGVWGNLLIVEMPVRTRTGDEVTESLRMSKGETFVLAGVEVKYAGGTGETFVFEATKHAVRFVLETNFRGEVKRVIKQEEAK